MIAAISNPVDKLRRQVLQAMHGQIHPPFGQCLFDLLGEHPLGADLGKGHVGDLVARGLDDLQLDLVPTLAQQRGNVIGLPQREL